MRTVAELGKAVLLRSAIYALLLALLLEYFQGSVDYPFLGVTVVVVVVMHEAFHMIGMEALGTEHAESFKLFAVGYAAANLSRGKAFVAVALPSAVLIPLGFLLTQTGMSAYIAVGISIIIMHAVLLPIELGTIRTASAK